MLRRLIYSRWVPPQQPRYSSKAFCVFAQNHHVMFDIGAFSVNDNMELLGIEGTLEMLPKHPVGTEYLAYHRLHYLESKGDN